ncbi:MAG: hypothetical protein WCJ62_11000 [Flavobacterium sp.]
MITLQIIDESLQVSTNGDIILVAPKNLCAIDVLALYNDIPYVSIYNKFLGNPTTIFYQPLSICQDSTATPFTISSFIAFAEANLGFDNTGGGGGSVYAGASPTTVAVQNYPIGTSITGKTYDDLFQNIYVPFVTPSFASFGITQTTPIEVGTTISGLKSFNWTFLTGSNVQANSVSIIDVTNGNTVLASGVSKVSPQNVNIGSVQKITSTTNQWKATAIDTQSHVITSANATVVWYWNMYWGGSSNLTLNEGQIESLSNSQLKANQLADYVFTAVDNYKYFCYPNTTPFSSPTVATGFKDIATNIVVPMADNTDDAFYSNVENGWYYGLVSVTNAQGITVYYRVYRTRNKVGGAITIRVS